VPDTEKEIVLYCRGGNRSALAADSLRQMGYTNVLSMKGGYRKWKEESRAETTEGEPIKH
jgi:rhodanese-related sulfurtransferase